MSRGRQAAGREDGRIRLAEQAAGWCQGTMPAHTWARSMTFLRATGWLITCTSNCLASGLAAVFRVSSPTCISTAIKGQEFLV